MGGGRSPPPTSTIISSSIFKLLNPFKVSAVQDIQLFMTPIQFLSIPCGFCTIQENSAQKLRKFSTFQSLECSEPLFGFGLEWRESDSALCPIFQTVLLHSFCIVVTQFIYQNVGKLVYMAKLAIILPFAFQFLDQKQRFDKSAFVFQPFSNIQSVDQGLNVFLTEQPLIVLSIIILITHIIYGNVEKIVVKENIKFILLFGVSVFSPGAIV